MADSIFSTGVSRQPIDFVSGGQAIMGAAIEQKLADIEQGRAMAEESQKAALEAMSMKSIQGLDRDLQERYQKKFDEHRQNIIDKISKTGTLSMPEQMAIKNEREDIINQTIADSQALQARNAVREFMLDPNTKYAYDIDAIAGELSNWDKAFKGGEYLGDPRTILFKHQMQAPTADYVANRYQDAINQLDVESLGDFEGNVFTDTELSGLNVATQESVDKARRLRDQIMTDPNVMRRYTAGDGRVFEEQKQQVQQEVEDAISRRISSVKSYKPSTGGGSGSSKIIDAKLKTETFGGEPYEGVSVQGTTKQYPITRVYNTATGKYEDKEGVYGKMMFISPTTEQAFIKAKGEGNVKNDDGQQLFVSKDMNERDEKKTSLSIKKAQSSTERISAQDAEKQLAPRGFKYDSFEFGGAEINDKGNLVIKGTFKKDAVVEKRRFRSDKVKSPAETREESIELVPLTTKSEDVVYRFDVADRPEELYKYYNTFNVQGHGMLGDIMGRVPRQETKQGELD